MTTTPVPGAGMTEELAPDRSRTLERLGIYRAYNGHRRSYALYTHASEQEGGVLATLARDRTVSPLSSFRPSVARVKGGVGSHLAHEYELLGIDLLCGECDSPGGP